MEKVLIYGGSGAIGAGVARLLAACGCSVHLTGRDRHRLAELASELGAGFTVADVMNEESFEHVATEAGSPLAGLVYAVGSITLRPLSRLSSAEMLHDFRLNAQGAALAVKAALQALKAADGGASVVLFSSVAVGQGFSNHASISMAKGAVEGLTRALAAELAPRIRVNAIAPSLTETPLTTALTSDPRMAAGIAQLHALQRLGRPEDIAEITAFLMSRRSDWITGQVIGVDGGRSRLRTRG